MAQADSTDTTNPPAPEKPQESFYLPTDISPEEVFQAIGRLRKEARDEIHRLIRFLDETDNHMEREEAVDDVACDDNELDGSSVDGHGEDDEPSLGSHETPKGTSYSSRLSDDGSPDAEQDDCDDEPDVDDEPSLCGITADCRICDDHDYEADLGSFDRMIDQTKATLTWDSWGAVEGSEVDATQ